MKRTIIAITTIVSVVALVILAKAYFGAEVFAELVKYQKIGNTYIYGKMEYLKNSKDLVAILTLVGVSVLYGIIHTLGPGHGKSIVANYFLKKSSKERSAIIISVTTSLTHTGTAILAAYLFKTIFSHINIFSRMEMMDRISMLSGIAILTIGVILLLYRLIKPSSMNHDHSHLAKTQSSNKSLDAVGIGILGGIAPCPLAMSIMLLAISAGIAYIGVLTILGISAGMLIVLFLVGLFAIAARERAVKLIDSSFHIKVNIFLSYMQSVLFILIGLFMIRVF